MDTTKQREAFEAWVMRVNSGCALTKRVDGSYISHWARRSFDIWQAAQKAAIASIEIELKQFTAFQICHYGTSEEYAEGYIDAQNNANKAITAAGLRVKS